MPVFSHLLMLKAGRVVASGAVRSVLKSEGLSEIFDTKMRLRKTDGRYQLTVAAKLEGIV